MVSADEVFGAEEAADLFHSYHQTGISRRDMSCGRWRATAPTDRLSRSDDLDGLAPPHSVYRIGEQALHLLADRLRVGGIGERGHRHHVPVIE